MRWFRSDSCDGVIIIVIILGRIGILRARGGGGSLLARDGNGVGVLGLSWLATALGFGVGASCRGTVGGDGDLWLATWLFPGGWSGG